MNSLETRASYPLTHERIDEMVTVKSPGTCVLGYLDGSTFNVFYVGRSDSDVNQHLHDWVGTPGRYKRHAPSTRAAFGVRRGRVLPLGTPTLERVGACLDSGYTRFAFRYAISANAAFETECRTYHDLGGSDRLDNERHPVPPSGSSCKCPMHDQ
jgi:hypothetical protein